MEGKLWKWTNYWHGWQPRWFVLEGGVLQYYHSHEQMSQGSKGSICLSSCDIIVHSQEETRIDLVVAPDRYFYLHASTPQERQRWLVALGSAKAAHATNPAVIPKQITSVSTCRAHLKEQCQTILHNVERVQNHLNGNSDEKVEVVVQTLQTSCDHFIHTLEESMNFAQAHRAPPLKTIVKPSPLSSHQIRETTKIDEGDGNAANDFPLLENKISKQPTPFTPPEFPTPKLIKPDSPKKREVQTFFSTMAYSFLHIQMENDNLIPTLPFLEAASSVTSIFDLLGPTLFAPVKNDMTGNIQKLKESYNGNPEKHQFLQTMVLQEEESGTQSRIATTSLLWLKRGLEFMHVFLRNHLEGYGNLPQCASQAYEKTLKPYHGWIVRGLFKVIVRGLPTKEVFLTGLAPSPEDRSHPNYQKQLYEDLKEFVESLENCTMELSRFYVSRGLDDPATV